MTKLTKQYYYGANGEKKINCYHAHISKDLADKVQLDGNDEIVIYDFCGTIVIEKKYHCTCMECGFEWDTGIAYNECSACPKCKVGDIHYDINGGHNYNGYQKQRIEKDA